MITMKDKQTRVGASLMLFAVGGGGLGKGPKKSRRIRFIRLEEQMFVVVVLLLLVRRRHSTFLACASLNYRLRRRPCLFASFFSSVVRRSIACLRYARIKIENCCLLVSCRSVAARKACSRHASKVEGAEERRCKNKVDITYFRAKYSLASLFELVLKARQNTCGA